MSDDIDKAVRILRGECVECGWPGGAHTQDCSNNIWTQLELKLSKHPIVNGIAVHMRDYE